MTLNLSCKTSTNTSVRIISADHVWRIVLLRVRGCRPVEPSGQSEGTASAIPEEAAHQSIGPSCETHQDAVALSIASGVSVYVIRERETVRRSHDQVFVAEFSRMGTIEANASEFTCLCCVRKNRASVVKTIPHSDERFSDKWAPNSQNPTVDICAK